VIEEWHFSFGSFDVPHSLIGETVIVAATVGVA
jgi:hypothetical protein